MQCLIIFAISTGVWTLWGYSLAFAALSWMTVDWALWGKPSATGAATGAVCGLVAITPAAGFVDSTAAIVIGMLAGMISSLTVVLMDRTGLDDTLDVFACHGVGGSSELLPRAFSRKNSSIPAVRTGYSTAIQNWY